MAGTGKSSIARSIARRFMEAGLLGASFFFSRGREDLHTAAKLFSTIAAQLAREVPGLAFHIRDAIAKHGNIGEQALCDQWRHLILQPLAKLNDSLIPLSGLVPSLSPIVVIDALDECEDNSEIEEILRLLLEAKDLDMVRYEYSSQAGRKCLFGLVSAKCPGLSIMMRSSTPFPDILSNAISQFF